MSPSPSHNPKKPAAPQNPKNEEKSVPVSETTPNVAVESENEEAHQEPTFSINDRRFWAKKDANAHAGEENTASKKPKYVQELETRLQEQEARLKATLTQYKEAKDEFELAKLRIRRDIQKEIEAGKKNILSELLGVVDNLERALETAGQKDDSAQGLLSGVKMVYEQFMVALRNMGVEKILALHQPFDPINFEAISTVPVQDKAQDNMVLGVIRPCYRIGDEILRVGAVAVGKHS